MAGAHRGAARPARRAISPAHPRARDPQARPASSSRRRGGGHRGDLPGATLRAGKQAEEMRDALHAALDALERELAAHHEVRRRFGKAPGPRVAGTIARLFPDRGYGFILTDDGEEVYFHRNALHELDL